MNTRILSRILSVILSTVVSLGIYVAMVLGGAKTSYFEIAVPTLLLFILMEVSSIRSALVDQQDEEAEKNKGLDS